MMRESKSGHVSASFKLPSRQVFRELYFQSVEHVMEYWTVSMQSEISIHNVNWKSDCSNFRSYLLCSELRYWLALKCVSSHPISSWCDVGGFFGAFPLTLKRLGLNVAMTEALRFYSHAFTPLFSFLRQEGIQIIDHDPFEENASFTYSFDVVSAMAIIEHYPHSLKVFLQNMKSIGSSSSYFYLDVPNIAYWPKRLSLLCGRTPLTSAADIYKSNVPFTGHHHEYTISELRELADLTEFEIIHFNYFNYSFVGPLFKRFISAPLLTLMSIKPSMRECISLLLRTCS